MANWAGHALLPSARRFGDEELQTQLESTMQLNHLNLSFVNVPAASKVFQDHFGFHLIGADNKAISVLSDTKGFVLVISNFEKGTEFVYPGAFHIGFIQESVAEVEAIYERLKSAGV